MSEKNLVLLIDDLPDSVRWIRAIALKRGYEVQNVTDRKAAYEALNRVRDGSLGARLAVVDIMMSVASIWDLLGDETQRLDEEYFDDSRKSGLKICRYARETLHLSQSDLPMACYSVRDDDEVLRELLALGVPHHKKDTRGSNETLRQWLDELLPDRAPPPAGGS